MTLPDMTSSQFFTALPESRKRSSVKWKLYSAEVLPMWVAEMDVRLAPEVVSAISEALSHSDTGYPYGTSYQDAVVELARNEWDCDRLRIDQMAMNHDVMNGVLDLIRALTTTEGTVIVTTPVYPPFLEYPRSIGRRVVDSALNAEGRIDFEDLARVFAEQQSDAVFLLCNPHNPTGAVHTVEELTMLAKLSEQYQIPVISDEIHAMLIHPGYNFVPYLQVASDNRVPSFAVFSASKSWNLAGLKAAVVIGNAAGQPIIESLQSAAGKLPGHIAIMSHVAAMTHGRQWVKQVMQEVAENKTYFADRVHTEFPGLRVTAGEGTYLAWMDASAVALEETAQEFFLNKAGLAFNSGESFGRGGEGHVRVNLGTSREVIDEALSRMSAAISDFSSQ